MNETALRSEAEVAAGLDRWSAFSCRRSSTSNAINSKLWCTSSATP